MTEHINQDARQAYNEWRIGLTEPQVKEVIRIATGAADGTPYTRAQARRMVVGSGVKIRAPKMHELDALSNTGWSRDQPWLGGAPNE